MSKSLLKSSLKASLTIALMALATSGTVAAEQAASENAPLSTALDAQDDKAKARFSARNPGPTLEFFGVTPGMTVVEALPGGGWYSKILLPYLGKEGELVGVDYPQALWPNFSFMTPERIEAKKTWIATWTAQAEEWRGENSAAVSAFQFNEMPDAMKGKADAVLFIRAMHNLARFESKGGFLTSALSQTFDALKPGGIVGVVQHQAREDRPDEWADGSSGYLKKSFIVTKMQEAGFEFVGESNINENPKDQATEGDIVWRLPPTLNVPKGDDEKKAAMAAIGESNRMTLKFRKPS